MCFFFWRVSLQLFLTALLPSLSHALHLYLFMLIWLPVPQSQEWLAVRDRHRQQGPAQTRGRPEGHRQCAPPAPQTAGGAQRVSVRVNECLCPSHSADRVSVKRSSPHKKKNIMLANCATTSQNLCFCTYKRAAQTTQTQ